MADLDKLAKLNAKQAKAADRERSAIEKRRKTEIAIRKATAEIETARAFALGRGILAYLEAHPEAKGRIAPMLEDTVTKAVERQLLADILSAKRGYEELRQAAGK